jgi:predicted subunit of tRNA(5-methylaminomethyl-2-thiouridylate) methyltransferase
VGPTEAPASAGRQDAWVLFSAGKDSALAALLLDPFYDVTLVTVGFGVETAPRPGPGLTDATEHAGEAAAALGFDHRVVSLPPTVAETAAARTVEDGYPNEAIQSVHERALEAVAEAAVAATDAGTPVLADGTRRDDRVPRLDRPAVQSLEDRHGVDYVVPLRGYGRSAIDRLADRFLTVTDGPSAAVPKADYETAIRAVLRRDHGGASVEDLFPAHTQSRVTGRADE